MINFDKEALKLGIETLTDEEIEIVWAYVLKLTQSRPVGIRLSESQKLQDELEPIL